MSPVFSVIVPVYNRAHLLERALASVFDQSLQDFEIVVVDDGSSDDPQSVVEAIGDSRIRFVRQENRGGGAARNTGIDMARGRYIAFLDSDDRFLPHHLITMKAMLDREPGSAAYARMSVDRGNGNMMLRPPRAIRPGEHMADYLLRERGFVPTITLALDTETARRVRYDPRLPFSQDTDFAIRLYLAGCRFKMAEEPGAICEDVADPMRVSQGRKGARLMAWLDEMRPQIPSRAYHGCRGWTIAKGLAPASPGRALALYLNAVLRGCYRPRLAAVILVQVFMPDALYRRMADGVIAAMDASRRFKRPTLRRRFA
ncbi:MAG TPA: glycosyltransferase family A protein [Rhizomicrobium sp.]|jgi:glycosyltransferase involved in cell wall biosynthesis|nr:glycosyltransferase family A protein [Rhizomicrobium sp.]